jgi:putative spermidine/putrescine transport system permease protein
VRRQLTRVVVPTLPGLFAIAILVAWPLSWVIRQSLSTAPQSVQGWTLANYASIVTAGFYLRALLTTLLATLVTVAITVVLALPVSYTISRATPKVQLAGLFFVVTPLMVGVVPRTYGWLLMLSTNGPVNGLLGALGHGPVRLIGTTAAAVVGMVDALLPFMILPLIAAMNKVPRTVEESAAILGARPSRVFLRVVVPMCKTGLVSGCVIVFALGMSALVAPLVLGSPSHQFIGPLLQETMLTTLNWGVGTALAITLLVVTGAVAVLIFSIANRTSWERGLK